jgi:hypothetical protein
MAQMKQDAALHNSAQPGIGQLTDVSAADLQVSVHESATGFMQLYVML